jgi:hypothetical protein
MAELRAVLTSGQREVQLVQPVGAAGEEPPTAPLLKAVAQLKSDINQQLTDWIDEQKQSDAQGTPSAAAAAATIHSSDEAEVEVEAEAEAEAEVEADADAEVEAEVEDEEQGGQEQDGTGGDSDSPAHIPKKPRTGTRLK